MSSNHDCYEVVVVGLGAAGSAAAATLARVGLKVLALEAQDYVGGRVRTISFGKGVVELGAEWIHGEKKNIVYEHAVAQNIPVLPQGVNMTTYRSDGCKPSAEVQDLINVLVQQQQCDEMVLPEEPGAFGEYVAAHIKQYIRENNPELLKDEDFIEQLLEFINLLVNNHNASNDWNDVDAHDKYTALEGHLYLSWHKYGFRTFFDILLNNHHQGPGFPTLDIKLNAEVTRIKWLQNPRDEVAVTCRDGTVYYAESVIATASLGVLKERHRMLFKPELPEEKVKVIEALAMGVMDKVQLSFDDVWWPLDTEFFGFLWRGEDKLKIPEEDNWITKIFAASRPMGSKNVLTLWTSGEIGKTVETLPEEIVKRKCRELLQKFMGADILVPEPTAIIRSTWYSNPFTRGSYTYDNVSCKLPRARSELAAPLLDASGRPRVLFAGEATHETHFSTVHGAAETGVREAMRLLKSFSISKI